LNRPQADETATTDESLTRSLAIMGKLLEIGWIEQGRAERARGRARGLPGLDGAAGRADDADGERDDSLHEASLLGVSVPRSGTTW
jgi:hypothetical protein